MSELKGSIAAPVSATWTCKHGVHVVIDFGDFKIESDAIFKTDQEAQAVVVSLIEGIGDLLARFDPEKHEEATFALETIATFFAHMSTPQTSGTTH
jgi:hypothetical protein